MGGRGSVLVVLIAVSQACVLRHCKYNTCMAKQTEVKLWSVSELAATAGVSGQYLRQLIKDGKLATVGKLGVTWAISDQEAKRWLKSRKKA